MNSQTATIKATVSAIFSYGICRLQEADFSTQTKLCLSDPKLYFPYATHTVQLKLLKNRPEYLLLLQLEEKKSMAVLLLRHYYNKQVKIYSSRLNAIFGTEDNPYPLEKVLSHLKNRAPLKGASYATLNHYDQQLTLLIRPLPPPSKKEEWQLVQAYVETLKTEHQGDISKLHGMKLSRKIPLRIEGKAVLLSHSFLLTVQDMEITSYLLSHGANKGNKRFYANEERGWQGEGATGVVKLAEDINGRSFAVKSIAIKKVASTIEKAKACLHKEAAIMRKVGAIKTLIETVQKASTKTESANDVKNSKAYIIMPFATGVPISTLTEFFSKYPSYAYSVAMQVAQQLEHLHQKGIIHMDVKALNIHYDIHQDKAILLDFNLSVKSGHNVPPLSTPTIASPELLRAARFDNEITANSKLDAYAFGKLCKEVLALPAQIYSPLLSESPTERPSLRQTCEQLKSLAALSCKPATTDAALRTHNDCHRVSKLYFDKLSRGKDIAALVRNRLHGIEIDTRCPPNEVWQVLSGLLREYYVESCGGSRRRAREIFGVNEDNIHPPEKVLAKLQSRALLKETFFVFHGASKETLALGGEIIKHMIAFQSVSLSMQEAIQSVSDRENIPKAFEFKNVNTP